MEHTSSTSFSVASLFSDPTNNLYSTAPNGDRKQIRTKAVQKNQRYFLSFGGCLLGMDGFSRNQRKVIIYYKK